MSRYVLIQSRSPWESGDVDRFYALARALAAAGNDVTFFLVQNGVMPARAEAAEAKDESLDRLLASKVRVLADDFSLRERAIDGEMIKTGISPRPIDDLADLLASGAKALWH